MSSVAEENTISNLNPTDEAKVGSKGVKETKNAITDETTGAKTEEINKAKIEDKDINNHHLCDLTESDRMLAFSFLRYLQKKNINKDYVEACLHYISEAFDIDIGATGGRHDSGIDLFVVFENALKKKEADATEARDEDEAKFKTFLEVLEKKGYFQDSEKNSTEYAERVERARVKFNQRKNPYEGLSPDELKSKGNELMSQSKFKEAISYYTKAIELDPKNYVCYSNRAAAHLHLNEYALAVIDCEKSVSINDTYAKAYGRMGTAYFYDGKFSQAAQAFKYACKLEPDNATYAEDLKRAEEKLNQLTAGPATTGGADFGGLPPGFDFGHMSEMMKNPQFTSMMERMMSDPNMATMAQNMAKNMFGGGAPGAGVPPMGFGPGAGPTIPGMPVPPPPMDENGNIITPFGKMDKEKLDKLRQENVGNPKMQLIMEDVRVNGINAFYKHIGDPEVMNMMMKFCGEMMGGNNNAGGSTN